jgi:hypothetical protein
MDASFVFTSLSKPIISTKSFISETEVEKIKKDREEAFKQHGKGNWSSFA